MNFKHLKSRYCGAATAFMTLALLIGGWIPAARAAIEPVVLRATEGQAPYLRVAPPESFLRGIRATQFQIVYLAAGETNAIGDTSVGWPSSAKTAFGYGANLWSSLITSSVPVRISACWADLPSGVLGHAIAGAFFRNFENAPARDVWYPAALANALAGKRLTANDVAQGDADIIAEGFDMIIAYSANMDWYYGTDLNPPSSQYDLVSVVMHEVCHGLGFAGFMTVRDGKGAWGYGTGSPAIYDRFTVTGSGASLLYEQFFPNGSTALANALLSGNLYFNGTRAKAAAMAFDGQPAKIYAPNQWRSGSSYSHLDEKYNGTPHSLMTYALANGDAAHSPGTITMGLLMDIGWAFDGATPPEPGPGDDPGPDPDPTYLQQAQTAYQESMDLDCQMAMAYAWYFYYLHLQELGDAAGAQAALQNALAWYQGAADRGMAQAWQRYYTSQDFYNAAYQYYYYGYEIDAYAYYAYYHYYMGLAYHAYYWALEQIPAARQAYAQWLELALYYWPY